MNADKVPLHNQRSYIELVSEVSRFLQVRGIENTYVYKYNCLRLEKSSNTSRVISLIPILFNDVVYSTDSSKYIVLTKEGAVEMVLSKDHKYLDFYLIK